MTKLKSDRFRKVRGGHSRLLSLSCHECGAIFATYQKDGPGILKRLYIDRIIEKKVPLTGKNLNCPKGHALGVKTLYAKEKRPAFRLFVASVDKKITKA